jgi:hypothetical protein
MDALSGRNKRDKESLKRYLVNTTELDEECIGQVASLALAHESAEDVRAFHGNTGDRATDLEWPEQHRLETWPMEKRIRRVTTFVRMKLRKPHLSKLAAKWCPNEVALQVPSNTVGTLKSALLERIGEYQASGNGTYFINIDESDINTVNCCRIH